MNVSIQASAGENSFLQVLGINAMRAYLGKTMSQVLLIGWQHDDMNGDWEGRISYLDLRGSPSSGIPMRNAGTIPFPDENFDFIYASHRDAVDETLFPELIRVLKTGGTLCLVTPCNSQIYRLAQDIFTAYPDTGNLLEASALQAGFDITLLESFVSRGLGDKHDSLVAVFWKGKETANLPETRLNGSLKAKHIWTIETQTFRASSSEALQMKEIDDMADLARPISEAVESSLHEIEKLQNRLAMLESTLRQREEEIDQAWRELDRVRTQAESAESVKDKLKNELADSAAWVFRLSGERQGLTQELNRTLIRAAADEERLALQNSTIERLNDELRDLREMRAKLSVSCADAAKQMKIAEANVETFRSDRDEAHAQLQKRIEELATLARLSAENAQTLAEAKQAVAAAKAETETRFRELARVSELLDEAETSCDNAMEQREWLAQVYILLAKRPWWWSLLPKQWRRTREHALFREKAMFDAYGYTRLYPDVASDGIDPLRHYIEHGMREGRVLVR